MRERLEINKRHESMRGYFAYELYNHMLKDERIWLVTADLGYGMFDHIKSDFPNRFVNTGAAEQAATGIAIGLAECGKIPVLYSITNFLLYRPFETIRNYIDHENIPVKLAGGGRDYDYAHDGYSHHSPDARKIITTAFPNIRQYWPETKEEIEQTTQELLYNGKPSFLSLRR